MEKKSIHVVCGVICNGNEVLCLQKGQTKWTYTSFKFEFPGGKVEDGESEEEALLREIKEELDYDVEISLHLMTVEHDYPDFSISLSAYLCSAESRQFKMHEHVTFLWLLPSELEQLDWAAADMKIAKTVAAR